MKSKPYGYFQGAIDDLEAWTIDEASEYGEKEWERQGNSEIFPLHQWAIWNNHLPQFEQKWNDGDSKALIEALALCAQFGLPLPGWCGVAVSEASKKLSSLDARNWNDVFPEPFKGRRLHDMRREANIKRPAVTEVLQLRERHDPVPVTEALQSVAEKYAVSMEKLRQWYYEDLKKFPDASVPTDQGTYRFKSGQPLPKGAKHHLIGRWNEDEK